jgi:hypothetical protein
MSVGTLETDHYNSVLEITVSFLGIHTYRIFTGPSFAVWGTIGLTCRDCLAHEPARAWVSCQPPSYCSPCVQNTPKIVFREVARAAAGHVVVLLLLLHLSPFRGKKEKCFTLHHLYHSPPPPPHASQDKN